MTPGPSSYLTRTQHSCIVNIKNIIIHMIGIHIKNNQQRGNLIIVLRKQIQNAHIIMVQVSRIPILHQSPYFFNTLQA